MSPALLKKLCVFAGLLLVLWVLHLYQLIPHAQTPFAKAAQAPERIVLQQGSKNVELQKQGDAWKVASGSGTFYVADEGQVKTLLSGIKDAQVEDEISDRPDRAAEFEVNAESGAQVSLFGTAGSQPVEGIFGKQSPDFNHIYFRYPGKPDVYLVRGVIRGELGRVDVNSWRSRELINIAETQIQGITIEGRGSKTEFIRTSTDTWTMNGKPMDSGPVNALVGGLAHLRADDFVDPTAYPNLTYEGLTNGRVMVKGPDATVELKIGAEDPKSKRYPVSVGKDAGLAWLSESLIHSLQQEPSTFKEKR